MRLNDLNDGSIKTLLVLLLLAANLALTLPNKGGGAPTPGSARASRGVFGARAENFSGSRANRALGEAHALPNFPRP